MLITLEVYINLCTIPSPEEDCAPSLVHIKPAPEDKWFRMHDHLDLASTD